MAQTPRAGSLCTLGTKPTHTFCDPGRESVVQRTLWVPVPFRSQGYDPNIPLLLMSRCVLSDQHKFLNIWA